MKMMEAPSFLLTMLTIVVSITTTTTSQSPIQNFLNCFSHNSQASNFVASEVIYTPNNTSFSAILNVRILNKIFKATTTPKPLAIITAKDVSHVQATIKCAKSNNIQIRIRSGGHDYEGLSYLSDVPFIVLDMFHLNSVDVNLQESTTWVESGATLGKIYYTIGNKNNSFAFPSGVCFTVGAGGHFSGGGYGNLMRKFGLSIDNIIDAKIVDVNGNILDRKSMGEDLFWAIRGGGGASFGVILSWKLKLVQVTPHVTVFNVKRNADEGATDVIYKWQLVAPKLHKDLFIRVKPIVVKIGQGGKKVVQVSFIGQFLGTIERLLPLMNESFPELGLKKSDCMSMPWVNSTLFWWNKPIGTPLETLLDEPKESEAINFKAQSDYVKKPISKKNIESIWKMMIDGETLHMEWNPYGGRMEEILSSETPFPHRAGNLFLIEYYNTWIEESPEVIKRNVNFSRSFYKFMTPYVSNSPRETFLNYRDGDIGANHPSNVTNISISRIYGSKYFKGNFERLMSVKTKVDPDNFFRYEQSIPTRSSKSHM
ncbi:putative tetrahydroberberine oxidase [Medicago truncatula]|uniref:FAD-binding berberine family protein n=1 Tax=Medicago truncatula TaxID=3880 RepID=A0A072UYQ4_MEDTR|nr:berberine bridge enzyme-like 17 [Medicago truncatula]KEH30985.1 FAD-binding berberine family protein [Medicago truncatula]RHN62360.1 putative tetrahydroberberine oxidase [Medicago truncatula]